MSNIRAQGPGNFISNADAATQQAAADRYQTFLNAANKSVYRSQTDPGAVINRFKPFQRIQDQRLSVLPQRLANLGTLGVTPHVQGFMGLPAGVGATSPFGQPSQPSGNLQTFATGNGLHTFSPNNPANNAIGPNMSIMPVSPQNNQKQRQMLAGLIMGHPHNRPI